jgi:hypothetical protein
MKKYISKKRVSELFKEDPNNIIGTIINSVPTIHRRRMFWEVLVYNKLNSQLIGKIKYNFGDVVKPTITNLDIK